MSAVHDPGEVDHGLTRDGVVQLRRHWRVSPQVEPLAAMLLLHGIGEHSGRYGTFARRLNAVGIDVVAIDHRGFGGSAGRRAYVRSFDEFVMDAADQLAQVSQLGLPTVLYGHSMGGLIALLVALQHRKPAPDLLVLSGPALEAGVPALLRRVTPIVSKVAPSVRVPAPIADDMLATDPEVAVAYRSDAANVHTVTPALGAELFRAIRWANEHLDDLDVPTLVVHGGDDRLVPTRSSEPLTRAACVERRVLDGLRHEVHNEPANAKWADELADWVRHALPAR
jgi:acylglycerol lipase